MLNVKTPQEVLEIIKTNFAPLHKTEKITLSSALGSVLAEDIIATEYVPDFNRSTVDGYAVQAKDTFGSSESIPAILSVAGEIHMGKEANIPLEKGNCFIVPTGGALPIGADSVVMVEYTEDYGDGSIGVFRGVAPGENMIFRGDDVCPGKVLLKKGHVIKAQDIGAMAAIGKSELLVQQKLTVGVISTGDELVAPSATPKGGQIRDVNTPMLTAMLTSFGAKAIDYGIVIDEKEALSNVLQRAVKECDMVLISGGSSVGQKDATCRVIEEMGQILFHGIAIKPGKPTILGMVNEKPIFGLPGHPVAAYFITELFVSELLAQLTNQNRKQHTIRAILAENVSANQGRAQYHSCRLEEKNGAQIAYPIRNKSGLITTLAASDGFFCIERDCEGLQKGTEIDVIVYGGE